MQRKLPTASAVATLLLTLMLVAPGRVHAQDPQSPYPSMAPLEHHLMERDAEIALARSAAPDSVSRDAEVMVLSRRGYETAAKGTNGFVSKPSAPLSIRKNCRRWNAARCATCSPSRPT